jgi:nitrite reductase/ring-hydroxylating ferredoxin subunit
MSSTMIAVVVLFFLDASSAVYGFIPHLSSLSSNLLKEQQYQLCMAKGRGKGLDIGEGGGNNKLSKPKSLGSEPTSGSGTTKKAVNNWQPTTIPSITSLPQEKNIVKLIETGVPQLIDKGTNPQGAVSIVNHADKTYCFSSSCASCKIPLAKAKILDPNDDTSNMDARIQCDFCGATYNLRTGTPVKEEGGKVLGFLFNGSKTSNLPVYGLGEQGGKVFINIP